MKEKFKEYQFVYLFGKDRANKYSNLSLKEKRKVKASSVMSG